MADLPFIPFVAEPAIHPDPQSDAFVVSRFVLNEAAMSAVLEEAAVWADFAEAQRQLEELADGPPPAFSRATTSSSRADPSDEYLQAIEQVEACLRQRRAAAG